MRILVSSVGTRGDVQPAIALSLQLREAGHAVTLCVPPNFVDEAAGLGFEARPIGMVMRPPPPGVRPAPPPIVPDLIADQFKTLGEAAAGCDLIVGAGLHQYAARSIAELRGIPAVVAVYAPVSLPSADHPPAGPSPEARGAAVNLGLWEEERRRWNQRSLDRVNANRGALGLAAIDDVLGHILGDEPWLAADETLGPAAPTPAGTVIQLGAWLAQDSRPLPRELEAFLGDGDPPLYLGLGSMPAAESLGRTLVEAARGAGRRAILSKGWAGLRLIDAGPDCIEVDDINHQRLFPRVAAVIHHGGAGTTTAAAMAGAPQVITPMFSDQFYWGERVRALEIGSTTGPAGLNPEALGVVIAAALDAGVAERARAVAAMVTPSGAADTARLLTARFG